MKKEEIIDNLIDYYVNPNWQGPKANNERYEWKKELRKRKKAELLLDLQELDEERFDALFSSPRPPKLI